MGLNDYVITLDVDWASDPVIEECARHLIDAGVKLGVTCPETLFEGGVIGDARVVTNSTKLRAYAPAAFFEDHELLEIMVSGEVGTTTAASEGALS